MRDRTATYVEMSAELNRLAGRCDGLIVDIEQRSTALGRWRDSLVAGGPAEALEGALAEFLEGEPPGWGTVRVALREWVAAAAQAAALWTTLSDDERAGLTPPVVQVLDDEPAD